MMRSVDWNDPRSTDELFELALSGFDADREGPHPGLGAIVALQHRPTTEVLERAIELSGSALVQERQVGIHVLAELQESTTGEPAFVVESVDALLAQAAVEDDEDVLAELARAFGHRRDPRALPTLLGWIEHPEQPVRFGVACALPACARPETNDLVSLALIQLTRDESGAVRDYALFGFPQLDIDTEEIRLATLARVTDPDLSAARQALMNLAALGDPLRENRSQS